MPNMVKIGLGVWAGPIPNFSPHLFVFFARRPDEIPRPIATLNGSYAVSVKEVPFGALNDEK